LYLPEVIIEFLITAYIPISSRAMVVVGGRRKRSTAMMISHTVVSGKR
jgi:hypothetical protein